MQFLRVVHDKRKGKDKLICRTDDFVFRYDCSGKEKHSVGGVWEPLESQALEFLEKWQDVLHHPEYATNITNALNLWTRKNIARHEEWNTCASVGNT